MVSFSTSTCGTESGLKLTSFLTNRPANTLLSYLVWAAQFALPIGPVMTSFQKAYRACSMSLRCVKLRSCVWQYPATVAERYIGVLWTLRPRGKSAWSRSPQAQRHCRLKHRNPGWYVGCPEKVFRVLMQIKLNCRTFETQWFYVCSFTITQWRNSVPARSMQEPIRYRLLNWICFQRSTSSM